MNSPGVPRRAALGEEGTEGAVGSVGSGVSGQWGSGVSGQWAVGQWSVGSWAVVSGAVVSGQWGSGQLGCPSWALVLSQLEELDVKVSCVSSGMEKSSGILWKPDFKLVLVFSW